MLSRILWRFLFEIVDNGSKHIFYSNITPQYFKIAKTTIKVKWEWIFCSGTFWYSCRYQQVRVVFSAGNQHLHSVGYYNLRYMERYCKKITLLIEKASRLKLASFVFFFFLQITVRFNRYADMLYRYLYACAR